MGDLGAGEVLALSWPSGEAVMSVADAVQLTAPSVDCIILDVKTYQGKVCGQAGGRPCCRRARARQSAPAGGGVGCCVHTHTPGLHAPATRGDVHKHTSMSTCCTPLARP